MEPTLKPMVRNATKKDYCDVMKIRKYDTDYLPAYYDKFLNDPNCHCYVVEVDGKVVC